MKLLILDVKYPQGLDLAMRAQRDGHEVRWYIPLDDRNEHIGQGLAPIIRDYTTSLRWADMVFLTDNIMHLRTTDALRRINPCVVGATKATAQWEINRTEGMGVFRSAGIKLPDYKEFNDYDQAIAYVKKEDRPFVSKPSAEEDKALSYVAKTPADLVYMLDRWKKANKLKGPFILQEKIDGIEMAVGGWFGPHGFNRGWCENWEFKKLCNDDLGCATGEQGTVLRYVRKSKLADKVLKPVAELLKRENYTGYVDVNTIIDKQGNPWPLEFTTRPGWPTFNIQQALHDGDCIEWLKELCDGIDAENVIMDTPAVGVVMSIPDYPYSHVTSKEVTGVPIYGATDEVWEHLHPCHMMETTAPDEETLKPTKMPGTAGDYVLVMSGTGRSVKEAKTAAYARLKELVVPNSPMYRTDIGDRLEKQLPELQRNGYAIGMSYRTTPKFAAAAPKPKEDSLQLGDLKVIYV